MTMTMSKLSLLDTKLALKDPIIVTKTGELEEGGQGNAECRRAKFPHHAWTEFKDAVPFLL